MDTGVASTQEVSQKSLFLPWAVKCKVYYDEGESMVGSQP
jgi:hypothetical protein